MPIGKISATPGTTPQGITSSSEIEDDASGSLRRTPSQEPPARFSTFQEARIDPQPTEPTTRTVRGFTVEALNPSFHGKVEKALSFIDDGPTGQKLLARLDRTRTLGKTVTIREADQSATRPVGRAMPSGEIAVSDAEANKAAQKRAFGRKGAGSDAVIDWNADEKGAYTRLGRELVHAKRITTGTYTGGTESGDPADPDSKAALEEQRAVGIAKYANKTPSENSIRKEHKLALHEKTSSSAAVVALRSPETVAPDISQAFIENLVFENDEIQDFIDAPKDTCADCARAVRTLLANHQPPIPNVVRGIAMWTGPNQLIPTNHVVVVVNIAGEDWVIDPTANQFNNLKPMMAPLAVWKERICGSLGTEAAKWVEEVTVEGVIDTTRSGSAKNFAGEVLWAPEWYRRAIAQA